MARELLAKRKPSTDPAGLASELQKPGKRKATGALEHQPPKQISKGFRRPYQRINENTNIAIISNDVDKPNLNPELTSHIQLR